MNTETTTDTKATRPPAPNPAELAKMKRRQFATRVEANAMHSLTSMIGEEEARRATGRIALCFRSLVQRSPIVVDCTLESVATCVALTVMTGLTPGGPLSEVDVLPRKRSVKTGDGWTDIYELNWQIGFRGMLKLALRAGYTINPYPIYQGVPFAIDPATQYPTTDTMLACPPARSWEALRGIYVVVRDVRSGLVVGSTMIAKDQIEARRACSDGYNRAAQDIAAAQKTLARNPDDKRALSSLRRAESSPWIKWPEEMALKTAIRYAISRGICPVDQTFEWALSADAKADMPEAELVEVEQAQAAPKQLAAEDIADDDSGEWVPAAPLAEPELAGEQLPLGAK